MNAQELGESSRVGIIGLAGEDSVAWALVILTMTLHAPRRP